MIFFTLLSTFLFAAASAVNENDPEIFVAAENVIWRMNLDGSNKTVFATAVNATSLDYHHAKKLLFWSDVATHKIYSKHLFDESAEVKTVIEGSADWAPRAIAVDYVHDKIYAMDQIGGKIDVFELDGSKRILGIKTVKENYSKPHVFDIAVDPFRNLVFYGAYHNVMKAPLDFSSVEQVTDKHLMSGIALKLEDARLYFADDFSLFYEADYDGTIYERINAYDHPSDYIRGTAMTPRSLAVYDGQHYFLDQKPTLPGLQKMSRYYPEEIDAGLRNGWTVRIRHPSLQKKPRDVSQVTSSCGQSNCEYMCLESNKKQSSVKYSCFNERGERINKS